MKGNLKEEDEEIHDSTNELSFFPKGEVHGGAIILEESIVLFHWDGSREPEILED